jgi:hypothetical protein
VQAFAKPRAPEDDARVVASARSVLDTRSTKESMRRIDLHIVRELHRWQIQSAQGITLAAFENSEDALAAACSRARVLQAKGLSARVHLHQPGKVPEVFDYPPE